MLQISDDLEKVFRKHYDIPPNGVLASFNECKLCGHVKIEIYGRTKRRNE